MTITVAAGSFDKLSFDGAGSLAPSFNFGGHQKGGDLLIVSAGSFRQPAGVSAGWNTIVALANAGAYLTAFWRIADQSSNDNFTLAFGSTGPGVLRLGVYRSNLGWDATCIVAHSENSVASVNGTSYALASGLTGVSAGQISIVMGGSVNSGAACGTHSITGTSWTADATSAQAAGGASAAGECATTGTPGVPSITYGSSVATMKWIIAAILKEQSAAGIAPGLFLGGN